MTSGPVDLRNLWTRDEEETARNLYERGVAVVDVVDTVNKLYRRGRSVVAMRRHMHELKAVWGRLCSAEERAEQRRAFQKQAWGRKGVDRMHSMRTAAERSPWHPLNDPKPKWLQRRYAQ